MRSLSCDSAAQSMAPTPGTIQRGQPGDDRHLGPALVGRRLEPAPGEVHLPLGVLDGDALVAARGRVAVGPAQAGQDQRLRAGDGVRPVELGRHVDRQVAGAQSLVHDRGVGGGHREVAAHAEEHPHRLVAQPLDGRGGVDAVLGGRGEAELGPEVVEERLGHLLPDAHGPVALDVGVAADGAGAGAVLADVALQEQDVDDLLDGHHRVHVLGQAHRPADDGGPRLGEPRGQRLDLGALQPGRELRCGPVDLAHGVGVGVVAGGVGVEEVPVHDGAGRGLLGGDEQVARRRGTARGRRRAGSGGSRRRGPCRGRPGRAASAGS